MNYQQTLDWMFRQLPMYQRQGKTAFKKDLTNSIALSEHLNRPESRFKVIHIAGTNGKGSTSHMISSVLQMAGYKVGLYTSPHLRDFRERIRINGNEISKEGVVSFMNNNCEIIEELAPSFFEITVAMAFDWFAQNSVDIAVVEVGLGGRLDSTNIVNPIATVITNIGYDHMQFLGDTLQEIAFEKAGIVKNNIPVIIGEYQPEVFEIFKKIAKEKNAPLSLASEMVNLDYKTDLKGNYQKKNVRTCVQAVRILRKTGVSIPEEALICGLQKVQVNTHLLGRWQILSEAPKTICDTAHNKEGLDHVLSQLQEEKYNKLHIVLGMVNDKNTKAILSLFPSDACYYFCKPDIPRGLDAIELQEIARTEHLNGTIYPTVKTALKAAQKCADYSDLIFVGGSTFVVAEVV